MLVYGGIMIEINIKMTKLSRPHFAARYVLLHVIAGIEENICLWYKL